MCEVDTALVQLDAQESRTVRQERYQFCVVLSVLVPRREGFGTWNESSFAGSKVRYLGTGFVTWGPASLPGKQKWRVHVETYTPSSSR
jgi:hypothetical protein